MPSPADNIVSSSSPPPMASESTPPLTEACDRTLVRQARSTAHLGQLGDRKLSAHIAPVKRAVSGYAFSGRTPEEEENPHQFSYGGKELDATKLLRHGHPGGPEFLRVASLIDGEIDGYHSERTILKVADAVSAGSAQGFERRPVHEFFQPNENNPIKCDAIILNKNPTAVYADGRNEAVPVDVEKFLLEFGKKIDGRNTMPCIMAKKANSHGIICLKLDFMMGDPRNSEKILNVMPHFMEFQLHEWHHRNIATTLLLFFPEGPAKARNVYNLMSVQAEKELSNLESKDAAYTGDKPDLSKMIRSYGVLELGPKLKRESRRFGVRALVVNDNSQFEVLKMTRLFDETAQVIESNDERHVSGSILKPTLRKLDLRVPKHVQEMEIKYVCDALDPQLEWPEDPAFLKHLMMRLRKLLPYMNGRRALIAAFVHRVCERPGGVLLLVEQFNDVRDKDRRCVLEHFKEEFAALDPIDLFNNLKADCNDPSWAFDSRRVALTTARLKANWQALEDAGCHIEELLDPFRYRKKLIGIPLIRNLADFFGGEFRKRLMIYVKEPLLAISEPEPDSDSEATKQILEKKAAEKRTTEKRLASIDELQSILDEAGWEKDGAKSLKVLQSYAKYAPFMEDPEATLRQISEKRQAIGDVRLLTWIPHLDPLDARRLWSFMYPGSDFTKQALDERTAERRTASERAASIEELQSLLDEAGWERDGAKTIKVLQLYAGHAQFMQDPVATLRRISEKRQAVGDVMLLTWMPHLEVSDARRLWSFMYPSEPLTTANPVNLFWRLTNDCNQADWAFDTKRMALTIARLAVNMKAMQDAGCPVDELLDAISYRKELVKPALIAGVARAFDSEPLATWERRFGPHSEDLGHNDSTDLLDGMIREPAWEMNPAKRDAILDLYATQAPIVFQPRYFLQEILKKRATVGDARLLRWMQQLRPSDVRRLCALMSPLPSDYAQTRQAVDSLLSALAEPEWGQDPDEAARLLATVVSHWHYLDTEARAIVIEQIVAQRDVVGREVLLGWTKGLPQSEQAHAAWQISPPGLLSRPPLRWRPG
ncbi:MAG: hypothetical protein ABW032_01580 [Burkholderiaceae bacterium]